MTSTAVRAPATGDFGLQRGTGWAMLLVRIGTLSRWGHACVAVGEPDELGRVQIVEAMPDGVRTRLAAVGEWTWSNVPLIDAQRQAVAVTALDEVGRPYDWPAIAGFVLRWFRVRLRGWARGRVRGRSADHPDRKLICSELVAWCYRQAGYDLFPGVAPGDVSPGDLAEYLVEH